METFLLRSETPARGQRSPTHAAISAQLCDVVIAGGSCACTCKCMCACDLSACAKFVCVCARSPQAFTDPHPCTLKPLQPVKLVKMCAIFALLRVLVNGVFAKCLRLSACACENFVCVCVLEFVRWHCKRVRWKLFVAVK